MRKRIDQIVSAAEASVRDGSVTPQTLQQAFADIGALEPVTELDRQHYLVGTVRLYDMVLDPLAPDEAQPLREQRAVVASVLERQFGGSNPPYARSRDIVGEVATRLKGGENSDEVVDAAVAELNGLPFEDAYVGERVTALLAVHALRAAADWLAAYDESSNKQDPLPMSLKMFAAAFDLGGFDKEIALKSATRIRDGQLSFDGTRRGCAAALMISVGLALRAEPTALPAMAQPMEWLAEALGDAEAEANPEPTQPTLSSGITAQCDAAIAQFERDLQTNGFTEYHLQQATASLRELSPDTEAEKASIRGALLRLLDVALPYAPRDWAEMLPILRQQIVAQDESPGPPIDVATFETEGQQIVKHLRTALAGGAPPAAAFAQAQSDLLALGNRLREDADGDAFTRTLMRFMSDLVAAMAPHAEQGKEMLAADAVDMFQRVIADMEEGLGGDQAQVELAGRAAMRVVQSMLEQPLGDPFEQPGAPLLERQFAGFLRQLAARLIGLQGDGVLAGRDATEFKRIESRLNVAFDRVKAATSKAQWIDQQRGSLRAAVLGLRRFERRHHLMMIAPPWSEPRSTVNPNAVFVSGGSMVQNLVDAAARTLGYEAPIALGVNDPTHARWDLLSGSAIAVFDFTSYRPSAADPPGDFPSSPAEAASIAQAAAPTARAAYECGWAFVLGVPMVVVAREGHPVPFDIDVEPIRLSGGAADMERMGVALQAALFGVQRGVLAEGLSRTVAILKGLAVGDEKASRLIAAAAESGDATSVRLAAEGVLDRLDGRGLALALPAFPPAYPPDTGRKALFHVTAFRPWSEACQRVVRDACGDAVEHRIGYERFDPDIIRNIWNDIATSSYVVADITHLNPNAVLELAIAQAFGRPTLVVSQTPNLHKHLPPLAKVRIHTYTTDPSGLRQLRAAVDRFISG